MDKSSATKQHHSAFSHNKKPNSFACKSKSSPYSDENPVIWSNLAFVAEDSSRSSVGSNRGVFLGSLHAERSARKEFIMSEEEERLRYELAREIEKELEREIMEGIVVLVRRLSDLKAKQIVSHGFLKDYFDLDQNVRSVTDGARSYNYRKLISECSDAESSSHNIKYRRKESRRR